MDDEVVYKITYRRYCFIICMQDTFARATHSAFRPSVVCKIPLLARRSRPKGARPSARATIGYLVYKAECVARAKVSCIQMIKQYRLFVFLNIYCHNISVSCVILYEALFNAHQIKGLELDIEAKADYYSLDARTISASTPN